MNQPPTGATSAAGDSSSAPGSSSSSPGSSSSSGSALPVSAEPVSSVVEYRVSFDWGVPSNTVEIKHAVVPPIAPPPSPPLPYLVGIYAADHPEGSPAYQRISFYFRGAFPGYRFGYVPAVLGDASGQPIPLQGNAFLRLVFVQAQAHDESGASTVTAKPSPSLGFSALKSYGPAGDFEGHVSYGLGIQVAPGSDQVRPIRTGELKKSDSSGKYLYVVFVDVRA
jgi:hypothetical protein